MALHYTPEQETAIQQLRNLMKDELPNEIYEDKILIYKFLKARNFNLKKSESMLRDNLRFRKIMQVDAIITDFTPSEVLQKYVSQSRLGFDKEGSPVRYVAIGNSDGIGLFKSANPVCLWTYIHQEVEKDVMDHKQQSLKLGRDIFQTLYIYDMKNFSLAQATNKQSLQYFMKGAMLFQDNFPEMLKRLYVINASSYFTLAFSIVKTILASAVIDKIRVYGQSGWKDEFLRIIDADVLPAFLGGKRTDPDGNPLCLTLVNHGGTVPKGYYLAKDFHNTASKPSMKCIRLERQASITIPIQIEKPMSILNWEFEVKRYDLGFGLNVEVEGQENPEVLLPVTKLETELEPMCGMYRCKKIGKYIIVIDNSYSWLHHKDLCYRTWLTDEENS